MGSILDGQKVRRGCGAKVSDGGGTAQHQELQQKTPLCERSSECLKELVLQYVMAEVSIAAHTY
jgi:hypothetical protein